MMQMRARWLVWRSRPEIRAAAGPGRGGGTGGRGRTVRNTDLLLGLLGSVSVHRNGGCLSCCGPGDSETCVNCCRLCARRRGPWIRSVQSREACPVEHLDGSAGAVAAAPEIGGGQTQRSSVSVMVMHLHAAVGGAKSSKWVRLDDRTANEESWTHLQEKEVQNGRRWST